MTPPAILGFKTPAPVEFAARVVAMFWGLFLITFCLREEVARFDAAQRSRMDSAGDHRAAVPDEQERAADEAYHGSVHAVP